MKITLISIGNKMPSWVSAGFAEYQKRLKPHWPIALIDIPLLKRSKKTDAKTLMQKEGDKMLAAIPENSFVITLEISGKTYSTETLSNAIQSWQASHLCFLIGGPEGLAPQCLARADARLSLSKLTFPHPVTRVLLAEQLYRCWSLLQQHPYHK